MISIGTPWRQGYSSWVLRAVSRSVLSQGRLPVLLAWNSGACILIFLLLECWRPRYFLTDDNLSGGYPLLVEMGRHLRQGEWPFISDYLFGGHYDWSRDVGCLCWHPFYMLPVLLADTWAQTWMMEAMALPFLLSTTIGFTILVHQLREEFKLTLCDGWLIFYTMSFVFSMYILMVGPSWLCFLGNQSALPWLTIGILDRKTTRGLLLVSLITIHQFVSSYAGMTLSNSILLTLFALGIAACRHSIRPFFIWCLGNVLAYLILAPFLLRVLDGFFHANRAGGFTFADSSAYAVPAATFPFSFFLGNWTEPLTKFNGDASLTTLNFPYINSLLPCAAAWCLVPALFGRSKWRPIEIVLLAMSIVTMVLIIRPEAVALVIQHLPLLKSLRWPFREVLQFLFFVHLLILLRPHPPAATTRRFIVSYSLAAFLLPLPFIRSPTLNALAFDRKAVLSGEADHYWHQVRLLLQPTDELATVIDWTVWQAHAPSIPYTYLGTADFPALYRIPSISGYSPTAPTDQLPLKTIPFYWFGAFNSTQVSAILRERPHLKLIVLECVSPLKISLCAQGQPTVDLTPYLPH